MGERLTEVVLGVQNMPDLIPAPAAQYLRMSTERQEYSLAYQTDIIGKYALSHGFTIVHTYSDPATSGVLLRKRKGLQQLIQDVVKGQAPYKAILVYDVSRWGRFQDTDESAHYEFLCKSAGVPVHYCAEIFVNDDALPNLILKSLKRVMAREYSRELGEKVTAGQRRGTTLGFRQGGTPGYGLRRLLVSADRIPKQVLAFGERKSIATDRIILIRGPAEEVRCVREIYRMFICKRMTITDIARELNRRGTKYTEDSEWNFYAVKTILTHPKYMGSCIYGRFTQRLYTAPKPKPRSEWTITPGAFEALVKPQTFAKVQHIIEQTNGKQPRNRSDEYLLNELRSILARKGKITSDLIESTRAYRTRFGTITEAYQLINYSGFWRDGWLKTRRRIQNLRNELMQQIIDADPARISLEKRRHRYRTRLLISQGTLVSVVASRPISVYKGDVRWLLLPRSDESHLITLVARLNFECTAFKDMFLIRPVGEAVSVYLKDVDPRLPSDARLDDMGALRRKVQELMKINSLFPRHLPRFKMNSTGPL